MESWPRLSDDQTWLAGGGGRGRALGRSAERGRTPGWRRAPSRLSAERTCAGPVRTEQHGPFGAART